MAGRKKSQIKKNSKSKKKEAKKLSLNPFKIFALIVGLLTAVLAIFKLKGKSAKGKK